MQDGGGLTRLDAPWSHVLLLMHGPYHTHAKPARAAGLDRLGYPSCITCGVARMFALRAHPRECWPANLSSPLISREKRVWTQRGVLGNMGG